MPHRSGAAAIVDDGDPQPISGESSPLRVVNGRARVRRLKPVRAPRVAVAEGQPPGEIAALSTSADEQDDASLVVRAKSGDASAFSGLVRRHQGRALALAMTLVRDEHDAREVVQEAFIKVYRGLHKFEGDSSFYTWLYRIVSNVSIDLLRKPARRGFESFDTTEDDELHALPSRSRDPFAELSNKQLSCSIQACLAELPAYHRGVIEMRELHGMSYEEMACAMGVSKGTIMSRLFHARQKLQRSLQASYSAL